MKKKLINACNLLQKNLDLSEQDLAVLERIKEQINQMQEVSTASSSTYEFRAHQRVAKGEYEYVIYSDGACRGNPGPGSYGLLVQNANENIYEEANAFENTTNNKMELLGVIKGLEFVLENTDGKVIVVTDSKYVVNGMTSWVEGWKKRGWKKADKKVPENLELWQKLDELHHNFSNVEYEWVKGHSGHPENEYCDGLANKVLDEAGY
ncbi:MAG: ribonuclease HI [Bacteriovoracaceae bacterium]|nr:ribonuclease HI [Bacteriovoracaceae bacterium]